MSVAPPQARNGVRQLGLLVAAVLGLTPFLLAGPTAQEARADSTVDRPISRSEVIARAQHWVDHQPGPYDQTGEAPGPGEGPPYRTDCSGYVSMAWHLGWSPNTEKIPDYAHEIARKDLKPGDVLNSHVNHVLLFGRWLDDKGNFEYYSFGATPVKKDVANIGDPTFDSHPQSEYKALRYNKIQEDAPPLPPVGPSAVEAGRVVSARSADGRLEVFVAGADGVSHAWQTKASGGWSKWRSVGGLKGARLSIGTAARSGDRLGHAA